MGLGSAGPLDQLGPSGPGSGGGKNTMKVLTATSPAPTLTAASLLARNPHSALRLPGATYGSLSKSHSSAAADGSGVGIGIGIGSSGSPSSVGVGLKPLSRLHAQLLSSASPLRDITAAESLAAALESNERSRQYEYCVLVGNVLRSYDGGWAAFWRGDEPTSEVKIVGASAWNPPPSKKNQAGEVAVAGASDAGMGIGGWFSPKSNTAAASVVPTLTSASAFASADSASGGDVFTASTSLASEAAATSKMGGYIHPSPCSGSVGSDTTSMSGSWQSVGGGSSSGLAAKTSATTAAAATHTTTFRMITFAGTHIFCSAPTGADRDVWLASLHAGLESSMMSVSEVLSEVQLGSEGFMLHHDVDSVVKKDAKMPVDSTDADADAVLSFANSRLKTKRHAIREPTLSISEEAILTPPIVKKRGTGIARALRRKIVAAQGRETTNDIDKVGDSSTDAAASESIISSFGYSAPYESLSPPAQKHCISCGRYPPQTAYWPQSCPLSQYGMECRVDTCESCLIAQGLLGHVRQLTGMYSVDALERSALVRGRELVRDCIEEAVRAEKAENAARQSKMERELRERSERELMELVKEAGAVEVYSNVPSSSDTGTVPATENDIGTGKADDDGDRSGDGDGDDAEESDEDVAAIRRAIAEAELLGSTGSNSNATELEDVDNDANDNDNDNDKDSSSSSGEGTAGSSSWTAVQSHETTDSEPLSGSWAEVKPTAGNKTDAGSSTVSVSSPSASLITESPLQGHTGRTLESWVRLPKLPRTTVALLDLIGSPKFQTLRRRSRVLDQNCKRLEGGVYGVSAAAEFLEILEEHAREASYQGAGGVGGVSSEAIEMKKQAMAMSGDLSAVIRLLKDSAAGLKGPASTESLAACLEMLLDEIDDGNDNNLATIGFFWPQIRQIHLNMLPAVDVGSLVRIELIEDFLLTVAIQYSVNLALELVWGCVADLEESLGTPITASNACRRRRFAVIRFVCELESLLFDFDGAWGGGSISLRAMLSPSQHQAVLIRDAFSILQLHRIFGSHHLSRSWRLYKLRKEADQEERELRRQGAEAVDGADAISPSDGRECENDGASDKNDNDDDGTGSSIDPDQDAAERIRMANNCDYFSSQLLFTRRLGDIAERLRFTDVEKRSAILEAELDSLNSSRKLGGDPFNRIADAEGDTGGLAYVVHVPRSEGHVFRSKERTPVLLLMELLREESDISAAAIERSKVAKMIDEPAQVQEDFDEGIVGLETRGNDTLDDSSTKTKNEEERGGQSEVNVDIFSAGLDGGADDGAPSPMTTPKAKVLTGSILMDGSGSPRPRPRGLTEDSACNSIGSASSNPKEEVSDLVASMMEDHDLHLPDLGADLLDHANDEGKSLGTSTNTVAASSSTTEPDNFGGLSRDASSSMQIKESSSCKVKAAPSPAPPSTDGPAAAATNMKRNLSGSNLRRSGAGLIGETSAKENLNLSLHGETRREVLTTIFLKGMKSSNVVARSAAPAAQRAVQAMDRRRAFDLMNQASQSKVSTSASDKDVVPASTNITKGDSTNGSISSSKLENEGSKADDEAMEALRLLIIQNRVSQGNLSAELAASFLASSSETNLASPRAGGSLPEDCEQVDAGEIDPRLAGCGILPHTVLNALKLWKEGVITSTELLDLVQKDNQFLEQSALPSAEREQQLMEDSNFWGRFAFGERWAEKKARIQTSSEHGSTPGWDLAGVIVKSNDDLRQESFVMQLIQLCQEAFESAGLDLWVHPYHILATGRTTGIIEMVRNAMSFDSLKKRPGYGTTGLRGHLQRMTEFAANPAEAFERAQINFIKSLSAYSVMSYLFLFKDRHNGNLLLDTGGHVIHIDFGFVFGIAPGGSFSLETGIPFKLTEEMVDVMDGTRSALFSEFVTLFCCGFLALQANAETFLTLVEITCEGSSFPCFEGKKTEIIISDLRDRFCLDKDREGTIMHALDLIKDALTSYGTKQYDIFQYMSQSIAP